MNEKNSAPPTFWRVLTGLFGYVGKYKARVLLAFLLAVSGVIVELLRPWSIQVVVDYILLGRPYPAWLTRLTEFVPGADSQNGLLAWVVAVTVCVVISGAALSWLTMSVTVGVAQRLVFDLAMDVYAKLQRQSMVYHQRHPIGDLLQRASQDVYVVYAIVANVTIPAVVSLLALGGMFVILAQLDLGMALLAMGVVPVLAGTLIAFLKPMTSTTERQFATQGATMAMMEQGLSAVKVVQGFAREAFVHRKVESRARTMADAYGTAVRVAEGYNQIVAGVTGIASAIMVGVGAQRVLAGKLTIGELTVFLGYLAALYGPVNQLTTAVGYSVQMAARGRRVFDVLDAEEEVKERSGAYRLERVRGEVVFDSVTFGYEGGQGEDRGSPVLREISFTAAPGQVTAIVGATGAGKTSLVGLLSRFHDPWNGQVLVDGIDVRDVTLDSLRENISLVLQDSVLFPMSVADNIAFGRPGATRDEIVEAARLAHAHGFIMRLPDGYDTILAEKGGSLSGGERQRISIARAAIKDAPILILDEPTSSLDARTESQIFEALAGLMRNRTTFIISHRLSTIRRADQILALQDGRIAERGTHESLLQKGELYSHLYRHQHISAM